MKHTNQDTSAAADSQAAQYLTFMLGGESFGIGIMAVKEIIEFAGITEVPMMHLAARFGRAQTVAGKRTCIVIVELEADGQRQLTGVVVDAVSAVLDIPASDIEPAPSFGTRIRGDFIGGMGKVNGKFVILLNVDAVLALEGLPDLAPADAALA
jgi:purine-binding chemotaxis protein CheW